MLIHEVYGLNTLENTVELKQSFKRVCLRIAMDVDAPTVSNVAVRFFAEEGSELGEAPIVLPANVTAEQLQTLCNQLLEKEDDPVPIAFRTSSGTEIRESLADVPPEELDVEKVHLELLKADCG